MRTVMMQGALNFHLFECMIRRLRVTRNVRQPGVARIWRLPMFAAPVLALILLAAFEVA